MDGRTYSFESPLASTTDVPIYLANTTSDVPLDPGLFRQVPQGAPSVFDKAYTLGPHPYMQPTVLQIAHEPHPGSPFAGVHQEGFKFPVIPIHPSGSLCRTTFVKFIDSSQQGYKSSRPVISPIPGDGINPASLNLIRDWPQEGVSMGVSLGHTHQSTHTHPTSSNLSVPSTLTVISCGKTVVQGKERGVPKRPRRFQKTKTDPAASLSRPSPSLRPSEKPGGRHSCSICKLDYAQPQGLTRHQCETHKARLCIYCREFTWGRPYLFRKHLVKRHPGIDPDAAIDEAAKARRSATIRRGYLPLLQVPIPAPKCDSSWGRAEPLSTYVSSHRSPLDHLR
ncbi:hypothetical protein BGY98DRAFT_496610 [Russula aff. rugulosa BPL654]|nr:hypothetical protein BGY98DRAFT_496610 [Russula aff. rugulosa BPL654]